MDNFEIAKRAFGIVAQLGAGKIAYSIIKNNVATPTITDQVTVGVASFALGGVVAGAAKTHMDTIADELRDAWNSMKN